MTRIEFFNPDSRIEGFCCAGHSGYGEEGSDIVCASISAAVNLAITTIVDVLGVKAKVKVKEDEARITLKLPASCEEQEETVQAILAGLMLYLCSLRDDYPNYIEVMEV